MTAAPGGRQGRVTPGRVTRHPPALAKLLRQALVAEGRPAAFVLAGHNGSGKSTLWYERLVPTLQMPLVNADRLTASILPPVDDRTHKLPAWAHPVVANGKLYLRDQDTLFCYEVKSPGK